MTCRHAICDECTISVGKELESHAWTFMIPHCIFCGKANDRKFRLKPKTAGVRSIIAEGGGIKGIIPLSFLKELETAIGLPTSIHEHFDLAFGSSSGSPSPVSNFNMHADRLQVRWLYWDCSSTNGL